NCALGLSQLKRLDAFIARRRALAALYAERLAPLAPLVQLPPVTDGTEPALHLLAARIDFETAGLSRADLMERLRARGVGSQVHYIPVHRQPYWRARSRTPALPGADAWYASTLSLPLYPAMADSDVDRVIDALAEALGR
ncbi:MAG TPA: DegT/DnrJ/EryC1/StrS family aminotransferase, partial [Caulobacteraceae bacterium]|nr:DegT/DnrJ/EryC1/StrS family aminotransferase [Caulobacteraceae bacterium]